VNIKELAQTITSAGAAFALLGGVVYSTGWIVTRSAAKADAQEIAQEKANVVQQQLYEAQIDNERGRLESDIQILLLQINFLSSKPDRTEYDNMQLKIWQDAIGMKQTRLQELNEAEKAAE
jgi:hypothetical protein